jgi:hypothetical protein
MHRCRKAEGQGAAKDEAVPWDEDEVYTFLLKWYSGEHPTTDAASKAGGGGGGSSSRAAGWGDAALLAGVVAGCVYAVLRRSAQYALRKSESRLL